MAEQVLTGTWEEISRHAPELTGKTLCLTVLTETGRGTTETAVQTRDTLRRIMARQAGVREPAAFVLASPEGR